MDAVAARSTFTSQKSEVLKTDGLGPLLEVEMLQKCTRLWREAHFKVKMVKAPHVPRLLAFLSLPILVNKSSRWRKHPL